MPRVDGVEVLRLLKRHSQYLRIPRVMISGPAQERDIEAAYEQGVNSYFQKPGTLNELRALVRNLVNYWAQTERPRIKKAA
jgi:CheY-like chemotaxis protein